MGRKATGNAASRGVLRSMMVAITVTLGASGMLVIGSAVAATPAEASAVCGSTTIAYAYDGACATYDGISGWYGSYGPGFPPADGWVLTGDAPGADEQAPDPTLGYTASSAPNGVSGAGASALGFAMSEAQASDAWQGGTQYTAGDEAVAGELLYDVVVWGAVVPTMSSGVLAAYDTLDAWYEAALGATGIPQIDMNTTGVGPIPTAGAIYQVRMTFPGSGSSAASFPIQISATGGYFGGGVTSTTVTTDANGYASVQIYADSSSTDVDVTASSSVGSLGLDYYDVSAGGQPVVAFSPPRTTSNTETVRASTAESGSGTVSVDEGGDDTAYLGLAGGVYQVLDAGETVVATLTTDTSGFAGPTQPLPLGSYVVHEETAPPGYSTSSDQSVTIVNGGNVTAHFTGFQENQAIPATLTISDSDQQTGAALAGARLDVLYDPANSGEFTENLGTCTTDSSGTCAPSGNDGSGLLPGEYQAVEVAAPSGYFLQNPEASHSILLDPAAVDTLSFEDEVLGSIGITKSGNDSSYYGVLGAVFRVAGPSPSNGAAGTLTVGAGGTSNVMMDLRPGTYTLTESHPPTGYTAVAPFTVAVALGHATTQVNVVDAIDPSTLDIYNDAQGTSVPIVGGVFDVRYDSANSGTYDTDLGRCITDAIGACSPSASAGLGLLPGRYEVTEISAPPGYAIDPTEPIRPAILTPGAVEVLDFQDPHLVPLTFAKAPTGNYDPRELTLAGAEFDVFAGTGGARVATCTTGAEGTCATASTLVAGDNYCWREVVAPPGFEGGESGCLVASDSTGSSPIVVDEPGEYVAVAAVKVAADDPGLALAGALLDLYRMDAGAGPIAPSAPAGTPQLAGGTWMASGTSGSNGSVSYPLQLPGYAYCVVEAEAPAGFTLDLTPHCTGVLAGSPDVPAVVTTVTVADRALPAPAATTPAPAPAAAPTAPSTVTLTAHKYDATDPSLAIAGASYDLYVVGSLPSSASRVAPDDPAPADVAGDAWVARGTTDASGDMSFTLPSGYAWCLVEVVAPPNFVFDPAHRCTSVLTPESDARAARVELPEQPVMIDLQAHKFNSFQPDTGIPGASYDVYAIGSRAPGAKDSPGEPAPSAVPGDTFYSRAVTGRDGALVIAVPAGYAWCLKEAQAPPAYRYDAGLHCTAVLDSTSALGPTRIALSEIPKHLPPPPAPPSQLPFTGLAVEPIATAAAALGGSGALLIRSGRRRGGGDTR